MKTDIDIAREAEIQAIETIAAKLGIEDDYGSIIPGKFANFTILSDNPLAIDPLKIDQINVEGTIVEGRLFQK